MGGVFGVTAAMVIEERKRVAVASSIKAGLTDVGHQSFFAPVHVCVCVHLPWCACASEREISTMHLYSKGRSSRL